MAEWSEEEIELLEIWLGQGWTHKEIANELGRTYYSIKCKCNSLHLKSSSRKLTTEEYKLSIPNEIQLVDEYIDDRTKIKHKHICGHEWLVRPTDIKQGRGCPRCNLKGTYQSMTKKQIDVLGYPLYLYHVKLQYEDEIFYKYGLTKKEDKSRYKQYLPYKVLKEISFEKHDAWIAIQKEKALISNYTPKHKFSGWTECYNFGSLKAGKKLPNRIKA